MARRSAFLHPTPGPLPATSPPSPSSNPACRRPSTAWRRSARRATVGMAIRRQRDNPSSPLGEPERPSSLDEAYPDAANAAKSAKSASSEPEDAPKESAAPPGSAMPLPTLNTLTDLNLSSFDVGAPGESAPPPIRRVDEDEDEEKEFDVVEFVRSALAELQLVQWAPVDEVGKLFLLCLASLVVIVVFVYGVDRALVYMSSVLFGTNYK